MDTIGILPFVRGALVHDHWKPYYRYMECRHALCNAHHLRELTAVLENDRQAWTKALHDLLLAMNQSVDETGGTLTPRASENGTEIQ